MRKLRYILGAVVILCTGLKHATAQTDSTRSRGGSGAVKSKARHEKKAAAEINPYVDTSGRAWYLLTGFDVGLKRLGGRYSYSYEGEFENPAIPTANEYNWQKNTNHDNNNPVGLTNIKLDAMLARNRCFRFGLSYNIGIMDMYAYDMDVQPDGSVKYTRQSSTTTYAFLGISAIAQYSYYFNKYKKQSPYVYGSAALGFYRSSQDFTGPGHNYFGQGRVGFGYNFRNDAMLHLYFSYDQYWYHERTESQIFNRMEKTDIHVPVWYLGIGFAKQFTIIPD